MMQFGWKTFMITKNEQNFNSTFLPIVNRNKTSLVSELVNINKVG